jgi:hypothetical protein
MTHGKVTANTASAAAGTTVTLTVSPDANYQLTANSLAVKKADNSVVTVTGSGNTYTFTMPSGGATVTAQFEAVPPNSYSVTIDPAVTNGSVSANPAGAVAGTEITLTVTPAAEYRLEGKPTVTSGGSAVTVTGSGNTWKFTMPAGDATVTAQFTAITYPITIDSSIAHGTVTANTTSATVGTEITLTVTPASAEYQLKEGSLKVNDGAVAVTPGSDNTYTFKMPSGGVTVAAVFEAVSAVPDGWIAVDSAETLAKIGTNAEYPLNGQYKQTANFSISNPWTPIGLQATPFTGEYDGNDKVITPNNITSTTQFGIFLYTDGATLKNMHIGQGSITTTSDNSIGGIVATADNTSFTNCSNAATLTSPGGSIAGICLVLKTGSIIDRCWNTGNMTSTEGNASGICATLMGNSVIQNSYNKGNINGAYGAGGITDTMSKGQIIACYNTGTVTITETYSYAGGIVGINTDDDSQAIIACYNEGAVSSNATLGNGDFNSLGGIAGWTLTGHIAITACYNIGIVSLTGTNNEGYVYVGGITGYSAETPDTGTVTKAAEITACYWKAEGNTANGRGAVRTDTTDETTAQPSDAGTVKFASNAWPTTSTHTEWGTGTGSGSGQYWQSLGSWSSGNPTYPKLWFEED